MYLVLLGAPGAGKGTQAAVLTQKLKLAHIASGDLFRQALGKGTELGLQAKAYMEKGQLVPNEITIKMVLESITGSGLRRRALFWMGFLVMWNKLRPWMKP